MILFLSHYLFLSFFLFHTFSFSFPHSFYIGGCLLYIMLYMPNTRGFFRLLCLCQEFYIIKAEQLISKGKKKRISYNYFN